MSDSEEYELYLAAAASCVAVVSLKAEKKKRNRPWTKKWLSKRSSGRGVLSLLNNELLTEDPTSYRNFLRMTNPVFQHVLHLIEKDITKLDTVMRESISAKNRLEVTLRFLATGETYRSLMYSTRIHETTISKIVPQVCEAIVKNLKNIYLKVPNTEHEWEEVAEKFYNMCDFPHCLGALDGRHINFRAPRSAGSYYYNYKGDHSIVLLGLVNADYKFTYVNVGVNGRISDGGVFRESKLNEAIENNSLNFPKDKPLPNRVKNMPYVIIADDAFPLKRRIMKPFSQRGLHHDRRIYNYRLSRARRTVEQAFGILANRFRVLLTPINLCVEKVILLTLTCVILHNLLCKENTQSSDIHNTLDFTSTLNHVSPQLGNRSSVDAQEVREEFKEFFNGVGAREWQEAQIEKNNM